MFRRSDDFPFTRLLEDSWRDVLDEYRNVATRMDAWPETQYYKGDWGTFGLYAFGHKQATNCAACPRTTLLVQQIPGMVMAGFFPTVPGAPITPPQRYRGL